MKKDVLQEDQRRFAISQRYQLVRDAIFLILMATHRLKDSWQYYDCSKNPDFDDLHHNVHYAESFIEFALEQLQEIAERDFELGCTPVQLNKEKENGRRARSGSRKKRTKIKK